MQTVDKIFQAQIEVKKSTFLAFLTPFDEFEKQREFLKQKHPKTNHIVWAYRVLNEFSQIVENQSDDGEPKGTSGPACLNVLRGSELVNCGVLVVRYFGGIKLGTGGLVRAYGSSVNEVIGVADLKPYEITKEIKFSIPYELLRVFEYHLNTNNINPKDKNFEAKGVVFSLNLTKKQEQEFLGFAKSYEFKGFCLI